MDISKLREAVASLHGYWGTVDECSEGYNEAIKMVLFLIDGKASCGDTPISSGVVDDQRDVQAQLDMDVHLLGVAYYTLLDGKKVRIDPTQLIQVTATKPTPDIDAPYLRCDDPDLYTTFPD